MENEVVIDVQNVEKSFRVYKDKGYTLKSKLLFSKRRAYEERKVLRGISFQVRRGEAVGLIGHNGCGKSTTLKLLTKIIYPDKGKITMKGRVSSLIELGAGFHPDMTGRENIYINASIFGLNREEIDRRLGEIIDFSELGEFIDTPVRTYSSGMYMRLAFSVAINVDADILLIDEILGVGDAAFQAKCFNKLKEIKAEGATIVIVSHSLGQIEQFCERSYWIDNGLIRMEGSPRGVHPCYLEYMGAKTTMNVQEPEEAEKPSEAVSPNVSEMETRQTEIQQNGEAKHNRWGNQDAVIDKIELLDGEGIEKETFYSSEKMTIRIHYHSNAATSRAVCGIGLFTVDDISVYGTNTSLDYLQVELKDKGVITCEIHHLNLVPGEYKLDVALHQENGFAFDYWKDVKKIRVYSDEREVGIAHLAHTWITN